MMFISGQMRFPNLAEKLYSKDVFNPATGELVGTVFLADEKTVFDAISSSALAFESWSKKSAQERGLILLQISTALKSEKQKEELAVLLTKEQGKPLFESRREIEGVTEVIDYFAGLYSSFHSDFYENTNGYAFTIKQPLGVCAAILPWNLPALIFSWKVIPALLCGNAVVVKPSTTCPLTVLKLAEIFYELGLPSGVLNVIPANGELAAGVFAKSPQICKISFTGSIDAGKSVRRQIADGLGVSNSLGDSGGSIGSAGKRLTLELGGSDAMIICDDVNIQTCAAEAVRARFFNCGQACVSPKRIFVFESIFDDFKDQVLREVSKIKVGNGLDKNTTLGPICDKTQWESILSILRFVPQESVLAGGKVPQLTGNLKGGFFIEPTVVSDISNDSVLLTEEIFGPIMVLVPVKDLDEAVLRANDTKFGLGASVWTNDLKRVQKAVQELKAGVVWVNQHSRVLPSLPFGGVKESGLGRENGYRVLEDYLETKTVVIKNTML
ncbi:aldehyde dehydrogenase family protein [Methanolapillus ohkumae]|uniref:Phenylacetaldehyde dehydrogenase n=1 Tax=Methanolapillus ohkumae TaxID=3028298 RepID=A0AA96VEV9_9EURY|nr:Phenylacetaldehyde dehydrogenase [Methanosarcinaceae archaeon Am2]